MTITSVLKVDTLSVVIKGKFIFSLHEPFSNILGDIKGGKVSRVNVNLSEVEFVDSSGLGMLLLLRDECKNQDVQLVLESPSERLKPSFKVAKFDQLFTIV